jgi:hypothetical protein
MYSVCCAGTPAQIEADIQLLEVAVSAFRSWVRYLNGSCARALTKNRFLVEVFVRMVILNETDPVFTLTFMHFN